MNDPTELPLRDIHLPDPVSWWPLSIGWWLVIGLILVITCLSVWAYRRYQYKKYSAVRLAKKELHKLRQQYLVHRDIKLLAGELSVLIRRLNISIFPRTDTASLTGTDWLRHLDSPLPDKPFTAGPGRMLLDAPYRRSVELQEVEPLFDICEKWIDAVAHSAEKPAA